MDLNFLNYKESYALVQTEDLEKRTSRAKAVSCGLEPQALASVEALPTYYTSKPSKHAP